jgi:hypothetical protein
MFNCSPGTMGLLCDPRHPALAGFPTAFHSERQWSHLTHAATPVILAGTPDSFRPIVQVIDNLARNEKLGLVFEAKVGSGSLLVVACDLFALLGQPEARQLLASLLAYAGSDAFAPRQALTPDRLDTFLRPSLTVGRAVIATSHFEPPWGTVPVATNAVDGDINTIWAASARDATPVLTIDLGEPRTLDTLEFVWEYDEAGYRYFVERADDGTTWTMLSDQRANRFERGRHLVTIKNHLRHLRVTITGAPAGRRTGLRELRALGEGPWR